MTPSPNRVDPPPFHQMDARTFEELCCSILSTDPDIATCDLYGDRGERQDGADLYATLARCSGIDVGQCKCYSDFPPRQIKAASDTFLNKWSSNWHTKSVRRFILFVASELGQRKRAEQILAERKRFTAMGMQYEAWSSRILAEKLAPHPHIVRRWMDAPEYWVKRICGDDAVVPQAAPGDGRSLASATALPEAVVASLIERATAGVANEVGEVRRLARAGQLAAAVSKLEGIRTNEHLWSVLGADQRAQVLRLRAGLAMQGKPDLALAKTLATEANTLSSSGGRRLDALIALQDGGPRAALAVLGDGPDTEELAQVRALALLRDGRPAAAAASLQSIGELRDPESKRVLAITLLANRQREDALRSAREAASSGDSWLADLTLAVALYYSALSPLALPALIGAWPDPPSWALIRRDDGSVARLREADDLLKRIGHRAPEQLPLTSIRIWQLACRANDADRRSEAVDLCARMLEESPTDPGTIAWALARALPVDLRKSRERLERHLATNAADLDQIVSLVAIHLSEGRSRRALRLLSETRSRFEAEGAAEIHLRLKAQATVASGGKPAEDLATAVALRTAFTELDRAQDGREVEEKIARLAHDILATRGDLNDAIEGLLRLAQRSRWDLVAPYISFLADEVGTGDAFRLAAFAAAAIDGPRRALEILSDCRGAYPAGRLPLDLQRLHVESLRQMGDLPSAISTATELANSSDATRDRLALADLHIATGNLPQASSVVLQARQAGRLPQERALVYARIFALDYPELSRSLWRDAVDERLRPETLGAALDVAHRLGLQDETKPLVMQMVASASGTDGPIRSMAIEEALQLLRERHDQLGRLDRMYSGAEVPVHLLASRATVNLAQLYHGDLIARECDPMTLGALLAWYGGRGWPNQKAFPADQSALHLRLDVTALLLEQHLELTDVIELTFRPLQISQHATAALLMMRDAAYPGPHRAETARRLLALVAEHDLSIIDVPPSAARHTHNIEETSSEAKWLAARAAGDGGILIDWRGPDASVPLADGSRFMNCRGFIEKLRELAIIDALQADRAMLAIGAAADEPALSSSLAPGNPVYFHANTVDMFADTGIIEIAARKFELFAEASRIRAAQQEADTAAKGEELAAWVNRLMQRVTKGIQDGTYALLPLSSRTPVEGEDEVFSALLDLLGQENNKTGTVIWIDDRLLTSHVGPEITPIAGIPDILKALLVYGRISEEQFYAKLLKLRAARVLYIVPAEKEVLRYLSTCAVKGNRGQESVELAILRRYYAVALRREQFLQLFPPQSKGPDQPGELHFVLQWRHATIDAVRAVWSNPASTIEECVARATLVLDALDVEQHETLPRYSGDEGRRNLAAFRLAELMVDAFWLGVPYTDGLDRRRPYLQWINEVLITPRFVSDADMERRTLGIVLQLLVGMQQGFGASDKQRYQTIVRMVLNALPEKLRDATLHFPNFYETLGVPSPMRIVSIGPLEFSAAAPWPAFASAIRGGQPEILALGGTRVHVKAKIDGAGPRLLTLELVADDGRSARIDDPFNLLMLDDRDARLDAYKRHHEWLDLSSSAFTARAQEIVDIDDVSERMATALNERDRSMSWRYGVLAGRIADHSSFNVKELIPPSEDALLRHLRISGDGDNFSQLWDAAARDLIDHDGLDEAFLRLSGLPVALPTAFLASVDQLDRDALREVLARWRNIPSPMSRFHLLHVAHYSRARLEPSELGTFVDTLLDCFGPKGELNALLAILLAVHGWIHHWRIAGSWSPSKHLALCWSHAHRVLIALCSAGVDLAWIAEEFHRLIPAAWTDLFSAAWDYRDDIAHPHAAHSLRMLAHGLAYAIGDTPLDSLRDDQVARMQSLFTQTMSDGKLILELPLMRDETRATNSLGSFLATDLRALLVAISGEDIAHSAFVEAVERQTFEVVRSLGSNNSRRELWYFLPELVGDRPAAASLAKELSTALTTTPIPFEEDEELPQTAAAVRFICMQAGRLQDPELAASTREWLAASARKLSASAEAIDSRSYRLLNACLYLAQSGSSEDIAAQFVANVRDLAHHSPAILRAARNVLPTLCRELPLSIGSKLWPLLIEVRCAP